MTTLVARRAAPLTAIASPWAAGRAGRRLNIDPFALLIFAGTLAFGGMNLAGGMGFVNDEGTYVAQANAMLTGRLSPYEYNYDHPPLGWVQLGALMQGPAALVPHELALVHGRWVMVLALAVSATLIYLIGRRIDAGRFLSLVATIAYLASPLTLRLGRQVYLDNLAVPWLLASLLLILDRRARLWHHVTAGVLFGIAVLTKETFLLFGPALLVALLTRRSWHARSFAATGGMVAAACVIGFYPLAALLSDELVPSRERVSLGEAVSFQLFTRTGSGSVLDPGSARLAMARDWFNQDPIFVTMGLAACVLAAFAAGSRWILVAVLCALAPVVFSTGYLPTMHVIGLLPFLALGIAAGGRVAWDWFQALLERVPTTLHNRGVVTGVIGTLLLAAMVWAVVPDHTDQRHALVADSANEDWSEAVAWLRSHRTDDTVMLVPFSMWSELAGNTPAEGEEWKVIALEKADLDSQFQHELWGGWRDITFVVDSESVRQEVDLLGLTNVALALEHSTTVADFGDYSVRRVHPEP